MEIYPAVDLYEGKVVRLERGDFQKCRIYAEDPVAIAKRWEREGARWIHVVDLEGARSGAVKHWDEIKKINSETQVAIQFGGGVRKEEDLQRLFEQGIQRVILGTKALEPSFLNVVSRKFPEKVAISLDCRGEEVQVEGWLRGGKKTFSEICKALYDQPLACIIVTDIERDGTLAGIDLERARQILHESPFPVIFSGGGATLEDVKGLEALKSSQLQGLILGKALYEGQIHLAEALEIARGRKE